MDHVSQKTSLINQPRVFLFACKRRNLEYSQQQVTFFVHDTDGTFLDDFNTSCLILELLFIFTANLNQALWYSGRG